MTAVDIGTKVGAQGNRELRTQSTGFELSDLLPFASQASFNSEDRQNDPFCLPNTRVDIIDQITRWAGQSDDTTIFWLSGAGGVGKTTIARTVAQDFYSKERLGASFFFRANGDVNNASKFFTTIAVQLAEKQTTLKRYIHDTIEEHSDIANQGLYEQWNQLIYKPLSKLFGPPQQPLVLVIDALDMCSGEDDVKAIIGLLSEARGLKTIQLKIFITCRPEIVERYKISANDVQKSKYVVCELGTRAPDNDISKFVEQDLKRLRGSHGFSTYWPGEDSLATLVRNSGGSFLWAATACRFICGSSPNDGHELAVGRFSKLLQSCASISVEEDRFNSIYTTVLENLGTRVEGSEEKQTLYKNVASILGGLVALVTPLSMVSLSNLLSISKEDLEMILGQLDSVIQIPDESARPLSIYHSSFRDFLLNMPRHSIEHFQIDMGDSHQMLGESCLRVLNGSLKKDACGLQKPGALANDVAMDLVDRFLPKELQYACENWVQHLQKGSVEVQPHDEVHDFLRKHLLHWLEALSLMKQTSRAVSSMVLLEAMISPTKAPKLFAFVREAKRFIFNNEKMIEEAPLQLYCSAILFAPEESMIRQQFQDQIPNWIKSRPKVQKNWSPLIKTLEGHTNYVSSIAFSYDSKLIATGSFDKTLRLWDVRSGTQLRVLNGHTEAVETAVFSPDNTKLASGSYDKTARLWDVATGALLRVFEGEGIVYTIRFLPDNTLLTSESTDVKVKIWDVDTGTLQSTLEGPFNEWGSIQAISWDGRLLVSRPTISTVVLRSARTGELLHILDGHSDWAGCVAFSRDNTMVTSAAGEVIMLWEVGTGVLRAKLEGHEDRIRDVTVSQDGSLVASTSVDGTAKIWDAKTGALKQTFKYYLKDCVVIAFSLDNTLVSGSDRGSLRLWDFMTTAATPLETKKCSKSVETIVVSPDGKLVTFGPWGRTIELWDTTTETIRQTFEGHSDDILRVVFTPDSKLVASWSSTDKTIKIWNIEAGALLHAITGPPQLEWINSIEFSPDSKLIATSSGWGGGIGLWKVATGKDGLVAPGPSTSSGIAFSADSTLVASGSYDGDITFWDTVTGVNSRTFKGNSSNDRVEVYAITHDDKYLLFVSNSNIVTIWDLQTNSEYRKVEPGSISAVAISQNGKMLASASYEAEFKLWDIENGSCICTIKTGGRINKLAFSNHDAYLTTDRGVLRVDGSHGLPVPTQQNFQLDVFAKDYWLTQGGENLLWLLEDYRATFVAVGRDFVILGHASGGSTFIRFDTSRLPFITI